MVYVIPLRGGSRGLRLSSNSAFLSCVYGDFLVFWHKDIKPFARFATVPYSILRKNLKDCFQREG